MRVSASLLGQAFSLLMRIVVELMQALPLDGPHPPFVLPSLSSDEERIHEQLWSALEPVWTWLSTVMDSTEAQLRLGCSLSGGVGVAEGMAGRSGPSSLSGRSSDSTVADSKRGFLSYLLSVMRCESSEHAGELAPPTSHTHSVPLITQIASLLWILVGWSMLRMCWMP